MDRKDYQRALDSLSFSADFEERTQKLLCQYAQAQEKETRHMKLNLFRKPAVFAAAALLLVASVSAAALVLRPGEVAQRHSQPVLAQAFENGNAIAIDQRVETGDFAVQLTGLVSGAGLTDWSPDVDASHTYAVVVLSRLDGTPLDSQFDFIRYTLTPLVAGYSPSAVNNWTLGSFATGFAQDGSYYYLLDTQDLNLFAHRTVYLAFYEGGAPSRQIFAVDPADGSISFAQGYEGPQALFVLPLDASRADPAAADAFVEATGLNADYNAPDEAPDVTVREEDTDQGRLMVIEG